jgi:opacity protein-like surface antigen
MSRPRSEPLFLAALVIVALTINGARAAHAFQIVPSIGISQAVDGGDNRTMMAVALRNGFLPRTQIEIQAGYRSEERSIAGQSFEVKTVPLTLSLWASPVPMLYAGGGIGAYLEGIEYEGNVYPSNNETQFGAHLGGGLHFPLLPVVGLDLQGRYVFLSEKSTELASGDFDPSFWTLSAGVSIGF